MSKDFPLVRRVDGIRPSFRLYAPDGRYVAVFHCEHFLKCMLREMFGLGPFDPIPLTDRETINTLQARHANGDDMAALVVESAVVCEARRSRRFRHV